MSKINADILTQLAQADHQDEFCNNLASMSVQLREAIEEQLRKLRAENEEALNQEMQRTKEARAKEQAAKDKIARTKRAKAYAEATNNYLPLAPAHGKKNRSPSRCQEGCS